MDDLRRRAMARAAGGLGAIRTATFLSSFLLFSVQFVAARQILPWFGGVPAVWSTAMLCFQLLLLLGYGWALALDRRLDPGRQAVLHLALIAVALVGLGVRGAMGARSPIAPPELLAPVAGAAPIPRVLAILLAAVGLPTFALAGTGPLLQSWARRLDPDRAPYPLYALSNAGSLSALLAYPALVEPTLSLARQGVLWACAFGGVAVAVGFAARSAASARPLEPGAAVPGDSEERRVAPRAVAVWVALAAAPAALLLATTHQLCQEVAVVPFLWVLPLALYLATWIACFRPRGAGGGAAQAWLGRAAAGAAIAAAVLLRGADVPLVGQIGVFSLVQFCASMACHSALAARRPPAAVLTSFYLAVAFGGALGSAVVALVAPLVFAGFWEFPLALIACGALTLATTWRDRAWPAAAAATTLGAGFAVVVAGAFGFSAFSATARAALPLSVGAGLAVAIAARALARARPSGPRLAAVGSWLLVLGSLARATLAPGPDRPLVTTRNFFGLVRVAERVGEETGVRFLALEHGQTTHGIQVASGPRRTRPTGYYGPESGIARAFAARRAQCSRPLAVGVAGLGTGTLAAYGRAGDRFRFYELDPAVVALASGPGARFTYLSATPARVEIEVGDARLALERELRAGGPLFDLLVVDAFSSGSIPVHLLTREALDVDLARTAGDGIVALHLSNRFLDLGPVARRLAAERGLAFVLVERSVRTELEWPSRWALLSRSPASLAPLAPFAGAEPARSVGPLFSDDWAPLARVLRR